MTVARYLPRVLGIVGLCIISTLAVIAIAKTRRGRRNTRSRALLAPYRGALIALASGEDVDGRAKTVLYAVVAPTWARLRPSVLAFLPKVRGSSADDLSELLRFHGEVDRAKAMVTSRSAVRRAHGAYVLGLTRDRLHASLLLPLLSDPDPDVRLVTARALGVLGEPLAASGVLDALRPRRQGQIGLPAWVAAEALLSMGAEIITALRTGLTSQEPAVRNVCAMVAGHGGFASTVPQLRALLATDREPDVRASAAVALGQIGGVGDVATLVQLTDASETTVLRRVAATALGELGRIESLDTLTGLLGDGDSRLAQLAAESLVRLGSDGVIRLEHVAKGQSSGALVAGAALSLAQMRGDVAAGGPGGR